MTLNRSLTIGAGEEGAVGGDGDPVLADRLAERCRCQQAGETDPTSACGYRW